MPQTYGPAGGPTTRTGRHLFAVWASLTLVTGSFILRFGHDAPFLDEWEFVPVVVGEAPTVPWLWTQHNEHRVPFHRLLYLALFRLTSDYRAGMAAELAVLSGLALGLMRLAAAVRGGSAWPDVYFPLILLHPGHAENWLWGDQLCLALGTAFVGGIIVAAVRWREATALRGGLLAGVCLIGAMGCGAPGLPYLPPVAVWLVVAAFRSPSRRARVGLLTVTAIAIAFAGVYFVGYERPPHHPPPSLSRVGSSAVIAAEVLSAGWGYGTAPVWPAAAGATLLVAVISGVALVRRWRDTADLGLLAVLSGALGLAAAIGIGRSGFGSDEMGLAGRYGWFAVPVMLVGFFSALRGVGRFTRWMPVGLCLAAFLLYPINFAAGWARAAVTDAAQTALADVVRSGMPVEDVVRDYLTNTGQEERALVGIPMLTRSGVSEYAPAPRSRLWLVVTAVAAVGLFFELVRYRRSYRSPDIPKSFRFVASTLPEAFRRHAADSGAARGLRWVRCELVGEPVFVTVRPEGSVAALVSLLVEVEPAEGAGLEDVPAARIPRTVTATFVFENGSWKPAGKPLFNLGPAEVIARSGGRYVPLDPPRV
jgi:hypothetical protein